MGFIERFNKATTSTGKESATGTRASQIIAELQAKHQDDASGDKAAGAHSRVFSETLTESFLGMRALVAQAPTETDNKDEEDESTGSSSSDNDLDSKSKGGGDKGNPIQTPSKQKARAKVSENMILSDSPSKRQSKWQLQEEYSEAAINSSEEEYSDISHSDVSQSSDQNHNQSSQFPKVSATAIGEEHENYESDHFNARKVSFNSHSDFVTKTEVLEGADSSQNSPKRPTVRATSILEESPRNYRSQWSGPRYQSEVRSEINLRRETMQMPLKPKAKSSVEYNNLHSAYYQSDHRNTYSNQYTHSPPNALKAWSEIGIRHPVAKVNARGPLHEEFEETKHKPKVSLSAMMDTTNIHSNNQPRRKVIASTQIYADDTYDGDENWQQEEDEDTEKEDHGESQENFSNNDELMSLSVDPKIREKFIDLKKANESLLIINSNLESTVKDQSTKIEHLTSLQSVMTIAKQQLDHISKVEGLIQELSTKVSSQETEIKGLRGKLVEFEVSKEQKERTIFYDPKLLPLKSLPRLIYDRASEDITILLTVIVSLIYTIYVFPVIVIAQWTKKVADQSRAKIEEITAPSTNTIVND